jgi:hypothetical protein
MAPKNNLTGQTFGRLTVISDSGERRHGAVLWLCRCSCSGTINAAAYELMGLKTKSCGCLRRQTASKKLRNAGYGMYRSRRGMATSMSEFDELEIGW